MASRPRRDRAKTYSYSIDNSLLGDPFLRLTHWRPPFRLALQAVQAAAAPLCGRRDWSGFARRGDEREDLVCAISEVILAGAPRATPCAAASAPTASSTASPARSSARWSRGRMGASMRPRLRRAIAGERSGAGAQQAPAHGLCLEEVHYEPAPRWRTPGADRA